MGKVEKIIEKMRNNPRDWRIEDFTIIAKAYNLTIRKPGGSHVVFYHDNHPENICVPARRPIKPIYVKRFLAFIDKLEDR